MSRRLEDVKKVYLSVTNFDIKYVKNTLLSDIKCPYKFLIIIFEIFSI